MKALEREVRAEGGKVEVKLIEKLNAISLISHLVLE